MTTNTPDHKIFKRRSEALRANLRRRRQFQQQRHAATTRPQTSPVSPPAAMQAIEIIKTDEDNNS